MELPIAIPVRDGYQLCAHREVGGYRWRLVGPRGEIATGWHSGTREDVVRHLTRLAERQRTSGANI